MPQKITQLSVFLENRPGRLAAPCALLSQADINIFTLTLADTERFGIIRFIVRESEKAKALLQANGFIAKETEVVAVKVEDRPGGLAQLLETVEAAGVNIEYMYAYTVRAKLGAVMIFRLDNAEAGIAALQKSGARLLGAAELYEL